MVIDKYKYFNKINYKRFGIITLTLLIGFLSYIITNKEDNNVISTMSVPVTNKVIIVDAGHGRRRWRSC